MKNKKHNLIYQIAWLFIIILILFGCLILAVPWWVFSGIKNVITREEQYAVYW